MAGIDVTIEDRIATLRINRPDKRNAFTTAMWRQLPSLLDTLAADPGVHVVLVTGAGGTFSAGADLDELAERPDEVVAINVAAEQALATFGKPTIAVIQGACIGGGCELAIACDLRFADTTARLGVTPAKIGMVYPAAPLSAMIKLIGRAAAKYLLYSADLIDAAHALRIGLIDELIWRGNVQRRAEDFARTLTRRSALTHHAVKQSVAMLDAGSIDDAAVPRWLHQARTSGELAEGVRAFRERRTPVFPWQPGRSPADDGYQKETL